MASPGVTLKLDKSRLDKLRRGLQGKAEQVLDIAAHNIESYAKQVVPVDTGALKNSIQVLPKEKPLERVVNAGMEYSWFVEFGSRGRAPKPYMTPAVEHERKRLHEAWDLLFEV